MNRSTVIKRTVSAQAMWRLGISLFYKHVCFLVIGLLLFSQAWASDILVRQVHIEGNRRIDTAILSPKTMVKPGDIFSPEAVRLSIEALYKTGFFDNIEAESEPMEGGLALTFIVHERPFLTEVLFSGNHHLSTMELKERITLKTQTFLEEQAVHSQVEAIKARYQEEGFYHVQVTPEVRPLAEGQVAIVFQIEEGKRARVREIRFAGNHAFDARTLQKQIQTAPYSRLTSWWTHADRYQDAVIGRDAAQLRAFYMDHGYLQVKVDRPEATFNANQTAVAITFNFIEGEPFRIQQIDITGNTGVKTDTLRGLIQSAPGHMASRSIIQSDLQRLTEFYGEQGYLFARVIPEWIPDVARKTVALRYQIEEGEPVSVREIRITGNDKTRDWVIRRELRVNEQAPINTALLRRSVQRLQNLNFFENIDLKHELIEPGWVDLHLHVKEKMTGVFSVGGNYNSVDKFGVVVDITLGNLLGRGQLLRVKADTGEKRKTYSLTFREPYLFDSEFAATADIFDQLHDFAKTYKEKRRGGSLALSRALGEYENAQLSYTLEDVGIIDLTPEAPILIKEQAGKRTTSALGLSVSRDTRDLVFDPSEGGRFVLYSSYAGTFLGGDNDYAKVVGDIGHFFKLWGKEGGKHVLSLHARAGEAKGIGAKKLPIGERFFVGGMNTVRGFKYGRAGPIDAKTKEILGGDRELFFNVEYLFPLVAEARIKGVFFYDLGRGFGDKESVTFSALRRAAGVGIRFISPIGPIRIEWGKNLHPEKGETSELTEFSIGTLF